MVMTLIRFRAVWIIIVSFSRSIIFFDIPNNQQHIYSLFTQTLSDLHWESVRSHHLSLLYSLQCHLLSTSSLFISGVTSSFGTPSEKIGHFISSLILSCSDKTSPCPSLKTGYCMVRILGRRHPFCYIVSPAVARAAEVHCQRPSEGAQWLHNAYRRLITSHRKFYSYNPSLICLVRRYIFARFVTCRCYFMNLLTFSSSNNVGHYSSSIYFK